MSTAKRVLYRDAGVDIDEADRAALEAYHSRWKYCFASRSDSHPAHEQARLRGLPEDRRHVGASTPVQDLRAGGCCDSSKNKYATKHFHGTEHPLVRSIETESRGYGYTDDVMVGVESCEE